MAFDLCKEVLLLVVMCWRNIAYRKEKINTTCDVWKLLAAVTNGDSYHLNLCYRNCETTFLFRRYLTLHAYEQKVGR